ncbi:MAG: ZinT/AdcA family metal-binding protein [Treponema sp.]|nr:ZinT/AdcA family metal-binding protein [Treponema sp.]
MKKRHDSLLHGVCVANSEAKSRRLLAGFVVLLITAIFTVAGCDNGGGSDDPELAEWNGTWNSYYDYFDEPELVAILEDQYDASDAYKTMFATFDPFLAFVKNLALTDFDSFVVQGDTITFYKRMKTIDTVTYTYKGVRQVVWGQETADFYAFEGDKAGDHKYLIFEEADRDTADGPLHFHMRYGSESIDSLVSGAGMWAPTIVSYDTTIAELKVFMSGD